MQKTGIAIFASGSGTNAREIMRFEAQASYSVQCIVTNKAKAGVLSYAQAFNKPSFVLQPGELTKPQGLIGNLKQQGVSWIVLAGFLKQIPKELIDAFPNRIINIHPALLPAYGGKGMYGIRVHQAVCKAGEKETGITIHLVNENYDEGRILFQARTLIAQGDGPNEVAKKVQALEHAYFPKVIESLVANSSFQ